MSMSKVLGAAVGALILSTTASFAWESAGRAYPYAGVANHCPRGLGPVVVSGVISCGSPTVHQSYQTYKSQPTYQPAHRVKKRRASHVMVTQRQVYRPAPTYQTHTVEGW